MNTDFNQLKDCLPVGLSLVDGLAAYIRWELNFHIINPIGDRVFVAMSLDISVAPRISINCKRLLESGLQIKGLYVGKGAASPNPELKPHFSTIGRVIDVIGEKLILDDVKPGNSNEVQAADVYLEPKETTLEYCIRSFYQDKAQDYLPNIEQFLSAYHVGDSKYLKLKAALEKIQKLKLNLAQNVAFMVGDFLCENLPKDKHFEVYNAEKPVFVFDHGSAKTKTQNDTGLRTFGPFSRETFTPSKLEVCVICQASKKGRVETALHKFIHGLPSVPFGANGSTYQYTGFKNKYRLHDCILTFITAEDDSIEAYNKAITGVLSQMTIGKRFDLALVQVDREFRTRRNATNPYLLAKARFIMQQIPIQEFTLECLDLPDNRAMWTFNNMALATYAKLGGVPWLLTSDKTIAHEVVFGIGSAMVHTGRFGVRERMIGITTVFTGDGRYHLNNISAAVNEDQYFDALLESLRSTIQRIKQDFNWQPKDSVRLIFHAFKTFKDVEAEAVKKVMSEIGDFNVEYAFVHVAQGHPFLLFNTDNKTGHYGKGIFSPTRTTYLQMSKHTSLVVLTGGQELKKKTDGIPSPVRLILHKDSTFTDMAYLCKQIVKFGAHSWRSFSAAPMPVSIYYSQLMAQMLSQLTEVNTWSPDALFNKIGSTRWFL